MPSEIGLLFFDDGGRRLGGGAHGFEAGAVRVERGGGVGGEIVAPAGADAGGYAGAVRLAGGQLPLLGHARPQQPTHLRLPHEDQEDGQALQRVAHVGEDPHVRRTADHHRDDLHDPCHAHHQEQLQV